MTEQHSFYILTPGPAGSGLDTPWGAGSAGLEPPVAVVSLSGSEDRSYNDAAESSWQEWGAEPGRWMKSEQPREDTEF